MNLEKETTGIKFDASGICLACQMPPITVETHLNKWLKSWAKWCVGRTARDIYYGLDHEITSAQYRSPPKGEEDGFAFSLSLASVKMREVASIAQEEMRRVDRSQHEKLCDAALGGAMAIDDAAHQDVSCHQDVS